MCLLVGLVAVCSARPARAQIVEMAEGLTLAETVSTLVSPAGSRAVGDAFQNALLLEVATTPLGNASSGFTFTFDSELGLDDRTSATFGPSFSERARTSGAGAFSIDANLLTASYDKIGDVSLDEFELSSVVSSNPRLSRTTSASLVLSSTTLVMFGTMGVTDDFDVGVAVPFVDVGIQGISWVESGHENPDQRLLVNSEGGASESGLGDVELSGKFRLHQLWRQRRSAGERRDRTGGESPCSNREPERAAWSRDHPNRCFVHLFPLHGRGEPPRECGLRVVERQCRHCRRGW